MGTYVPVRAPTGPAGPRKSLVPVRLRVYVSVPYKNRDQCLRSLAHNHCPRFVARTETKGSPLVPVPTTNRYQGFGYISLASEQSTPLVLCIYLGLAVRHVLSPSSPPST